MTLDEMNDHYDRVTSRYPMRDNPLLARDAPFREVLVGCGCGACYRVLLNGTVSIPDVPKELTMPCGNCGKSIQDARSFSGHSGGVFNVMEGRL